MLLSMDFAGTYGIAGGYSAPEFEFSGQAIATSNGGNTWVLAGVPDSARSLTSVELFDAGIALAFGACNIPADRTMRTHIRADEDLTFPVGVERDLVRIGISGGASYKAMFLRSSNSGLTWDTQNSLPDSIYYVLSSSFINPLLGYVTADASPSFGIARVLKTTNGGDDWSILQTPDSIILLRNIAFTDADHGVAVGYRIQTGGFAGTIIRTIDGGGSWQSFEFPAVDNFTDVSFPSPLIGYVAGVSNLAGTGVVCKTTDGGATWIQLLYSPVDVIVEGITFAEGSTSIGMLHGLQDVNPGSRELKPFFALTTDGGQSWRDTTIAGLPNDTDPVDAFFRSPAEGFLCGGNLQEAVMLYTDNGGISSVEPISDQPLRSFHLQQNFPNPFNPRTVINYHQAMRNRVTLKVYDVLGREIATLVNEIKESGAHSVYWDASEQPSGVYFYRLKEGSFVEQKKMVLMK
ncbi:MAG: T9SS type A sorting domain-containing protein [Bacteroidota bacterium]